MSTTTTDHPIAQAIDRFVHSVRDTKAAARQFIPASSKSSKEEFERIKEVLDREGPLLDSPDSIVRLNAVRQANIALIQFERHKNSRIPVALTQGLYLTIFSAFDSFTGELLLALFTRKPDLFASLNHSVDFSSILKAKDLEEIKQGVLDDEIETLRRKSYTEQFELLENRFGLKLRQVANWAQFIECSQRRNLITHCGGIVSEQYLTHCRKVNITPLPELGSRIALGATYFYNACEVAIEIGLKLGQTLWRKALPDEIEQADTHLMSVLYESLNIAVWPRACTVGEFAFELPRVASDANKKILTVNYCQALLRNGKAEEARDIMKQCDWSAASIDFRIARGVLLEEYEDAARLMREMGVKGERIVETSYHTWPLFIEFRETEEFNQAYEEIYGHAFMQRLKQEVSETAKRAEIEGEAQTN